MLKLVKLPSLVAKYCKTWKIYACKVCKFCILLYYAYHKMAELPVNFGHLVVSVIQKCENLQTSQAYIFRILQHFAIKLGNFTNFDMLFLASVKDFDFFAKMKIRFKRGMVHCLTLVHDSWLLICTFPQRCFSILSHISLTLLWTHNRQ